ncbi:MAG: hypothetical protein GXO74_09430 [Calditrichaeota bacterium]|nr:hypothetical protein [Calditrichota bacterium]
MKKLTSIFLVLLMIFSVPYAILGQNVSARDHLFVHLKTSLKHDDAQICVAYNIIWAALRSNLAVDVLVDADGINTFKTGFWSDKDAIQDYKIPENLRKSMAEQFSIGLDEVPKTYGEFLVLLNKEGAHFYINKAFLIVSGIAANPDRDMGKISAYAAKIFKPVTLKEMIQLRKKAMFDYTF